jgi:hypothetical protein
LPKTPPKLAKQSRVKFQFYATTLSNRVISKV